MIKIVSSLLLVSTLGAESFSDFVNNNNQAVASEKKAFAVHKKSEEAAFKNYKAVVNQEFKNYKKELSKVWKEPKLSSNTQWVEYSKDKLSRNVVDFKNETITVEVNAKDIKHARTKIAKQLLKAVTQDTTEAYSHDTLSKRIDKKLHNSLKQPVNALPILAPIIFKKPPSVKEQVKYAKKTISQNRIVSASSKVPNTKHFTMRVKMPKNTTIKRSKFYLSKAREEAKRYKMPLALVLAIMHSESNFNPMAKSHIPAYGLMQIVPTSAGADTYNYLYKKRRILSSSYLYNSNNNIKLGTAYLSILYYRYLKPIKNSQSRLYCTIASYNTGAGNVSRTFSGTTNPHKAAKKINKMSAQSVYAYMRKNLKYKETRDYLKRVSDRVAIYQKIYGQ